MFDISVEIPAAETRSLMLPLQLQKTEVDRIGQAGLVPGLLFGQAQLAESRREVFHTPVGDPLEHRFDLWMSRRGTQLAVDFVGQF